MSQFSAQESAHYRRYFDAFATRPGVLAPLELHACLCHFGPIHTIGDILDLIKVHDSTRSGTLNFDDFLHLVYEYKQESRSRQQQLEAALGGMEKRRVTDPTASPSANAIEGLSHRELREILSLDTGAEWKLSASDIDEIIDDLLPTRRNTILTRPFFTNGCATKNMAWLRMRSAPTDLITPVAPVISVRLFGVTSLLDLGRTKRRGGQGIAYRSIDPMITIRLDDISVNSTILANQITPKWDEELQITVELPSTNIMDIQRYIESHRLHFDLYDYQIGGVVPHIEWLAGGSVQLETALRSTLTPTMYTIALSSPHPCPTVKLEVAIHCAHTSESPLVELFQWPEEEWLLPSGAYRGRLETDLAADCHHHNDTSIAPIIGVPLSQRDAKEKESKAGAQLFAEAERFYRSCRIRYRRRHFRLFALDEYNHFRYLPSCITPITLPDPSRTDPELKWTASMLAKNVARIAERSSWHSPLPARAMLQSLLAMAGTGQHSTGALAPGTLPAGVMQPPSVMAAALAASHDIPAATIALHQGLQLCSPAAMIMRGYGSELEHSIFLCGCFLGLGLNAYLVLGRDRLSQLRSWVVVITESSLGAPGGGSFRLPPSIVHWNAITGLTMQEDRRGWLSTGESCMDDQRRFDRVGCVVNHTNVWINCQPSDIVSTLQWDIQQSSQWTPFISDHEGSTTKRWVTSSSSSAASSATSPFACWYNPHFLHTIEQLQRISPVVPLQLSHDLTRSLAMRITRHRRESLFIVRTFYHAPLSLALEKLISRLKMEVRLMVEPIRRVPGHRRARSSAATRYDAPVATHRHHDSIITNGKDHDEEKKKDASASSSLSSSWVPLLDPVIATAIPDRHIWYARAYHFNTDHVGAIFAQLRASGILNTSVPNTTYAIATRVYCYPWGLRSTWVIIGYFYDTLHTLA